MCQNVMFWRILGQISGVTTIVNVSQCAQTHTVNLITSMVKVFQRRTTYFSMKAMCFVTKIYKSLNVVFKFLEISHGIMQPDWQIRSVDCATVITTIPLQQRAEIVWIRSGLPDHGRCPFFFMEDYY